MRSGQGIPSREGEGQSWCLIQQQPHHGATQSAIGHHQTIGLGVLQFRMPLPRRVAWATGVLYPACCVLVTAQHEANQPFSTA